MKISVIIPTYKGADVICRAVNSVLEQEYSEEFEVIVVDDNSPDSRDRLQTELAMNVFADDKRVIYIKHECNKNGAAARNTGFRHSSGQYICFLDDDDIFLPNKFRMQAQYMDEHPEFGASYTWRINSNNEIAKCSKIGDLSEEILTLSFTPTTITIMMRRECYAALNGHDESFKRHQDFEFQLRFFQMFQMGVVEEPLSRIIGGANNNQLHGKELENLKKYFFQHLAPLIDKVDEKHPGAKKRIYGSHYAMVFKDHLKCGNYKMALLIALNATKLYPLRFWSLFAKDIYAAIMRRL